MRIGELASRTGLAASAIRFYEAEGLLRPPARRGGRRVFDESAAAQIEVVRLAAETGFTLAEIRQLVTGFGENRWRRLAERKIAEIREAAERLGTMEDLLLRLVRCECPDIDECGRALQSAKRRGRLRTSGSTRRRGLGLASPRRAKR
ncbi:MAG TPA: MerR family transcriptional regulator [Thermoanaerobaculia bacterium]|jgi:DNA-binding transcriptional MerR regulator|nr:MerR family transcriptional regulator [Thermoanaerobaculia bacterium]